MFIAPRLAVLPLLALLALLASFAAGCGAVASSQVPDDLGGPAEPLGELRLDPYRAGLFTVTARIAGADRRLLFDTGGGVTAITPAIAADLGCEVSGRLTGHRMNGERFDAATCAGATIRAGGVALEVDTVAVRDLAPLLPPGWPQLDGVLSLHTFQGLGLTLDLGGGRIVVESPRSLAARTRQMARMTARLGRQAGGEGLDLFVAVAAPAADLWFELDTGNSGPTLLAPHAAQALGLESGDAELFIPGLGGVRGTVAVLDLIIDGNLGASFAGRHVLSLDLASGQLWGRSRAEPAPETDLRGVEGFFPVGSVTPALLRSLGVSVDAGRVAAVAGRVGKLIIANGQRTAPARELARMGQRYCATPAVRAWNADRCGALETRRCGEDGQCSYDHFGNCSGFLLDGRNFLTAAHCVVDLVADPGLAAASSIVLPDASGAPGTRLSLLSIRLGKEDFDHHWVALEEEDPVDVAAVTVRGPSLAAWELAPLPLEGEPLFIVGYPRVERRSYAARRRAGYDLVFGTPTASFGRLADGNTLGQPLCAVDGRQEHWQLATPCPSGALDTTWGETWEGVITSSPFLATCDSSNGYSGAPVFDSEGRLVGVNATLAGAFDPQRRFDDSVRMVATPIARALGKLSEP